VGSQRGDVRERNEERGLKRVANMTGRRILDAGPKHYQGGKDKRQKPKKAGGEVSRDWADPKKREERYACNKLGCGERPWGGEKGDTGKMHPKRRATGNWPYRIGVEKVRKKGRCETKAQDKILWKNLLASVVEGRRELRNEGWYGRNGRPFKKKPQTETKK